MVSKKIRDHSNQLATDGDQPPVNYSHSHSEKLDGLNAGFIDPAVSGWVAPILFVPKQTVNYVFVDYLKLNSVPYVVAGFRRLDQAPSAGLARHETRNNEKEECCTKRKMGTIKENRADVEGSLEADLKGE